MKEKTVVSVIFEDDDEIEVRFEIIVSHVIALYTFGCNIDYFQRTFNMLGCHGKQTF